MCNHVVVILEIRIFTYVEASKRNLGLQIWVSLGNLLLISVDPHPCIVSISKSQLYNHCGGLLCWGTNEMFVVLFYHPKLLLVGKVVFVYHGGEVPCLCE